MGRLKCRWGYNIRINLKDVGLNLCTGFSWFRLVYNCGMSFIIGGEFRNQLKYCHFLKDSAQWR